MRDAYGRWVWRGTVLLGGIMVVLFALSLVGSVFLPIRLSVSSCVSLDLDEAEFRSKRRICEYIAIFVGDQKAN